jgi:cobalt-precorrin-5B (C1)-methyltransferase
MSERDPTQTYDERSELRRGWTTGACATAAARAAFTALVGGEFPDPIEIVLPKGQRVSFALDQHSLAANGAEAAVIKDAGDDPDVTHGALIRARVERLPAGAGIVFAAGGGVGTVTKPGLPLGVGEPAINPGPRRMMSDNIGEAAAAFGTNPDCRITISVDNGEKLAQRTWNGRLGILGGLSILGTTGIVIPYSCSAWIASIHQGIDVAHAAGLYHIAACTGSTSEKMVKALYGFDDGAIIDMGDFVGGTVKYLRRHPVARLTIAGGFAKLSKLAAGHMDLHSKRSQVDPAFLATLVDDPELAAKIAAAETGLHVLQIAETAGFPIGDAVARECARRIRAEVSPETDVEIIVGDRGAEIVGRAPFRGNAAARV